MKFVKSPNAIGGVPGFARANLPANMGNWVRKVLFRVAMCPDRARTGHGSGRVGVTRPEPLLLRDVRYRGVLHLGHPHGGYVLVRGSGSACPPARISTLPLSAVTAPAVSIR
jgi:hypothetical protein